MLHHSLLVSEPIQCMEVHQNLVGLTMLFTAICVIDPTVSPWTLRALKAVCRRARRKFAQGPALHAYADLCACM